MESFRAAGDKGRERLELLYYSFVAFFVKLQYNFYDADRNWRNWSASSWNRRVHLERVKYLFN